MGNILQNHILRGLEILAEAIFYYFSFDFPGLTTCHSRNIGLGIPKYFYGFVKDASFGPMLNYHPSTSCLEFCGIDWCAL